MRKVVYTFGKNFETTDFELAEKIRQEKKIPYGVRLDEIVEVSEHIKKIRKLRGIEF